MRRDVYKKLVRDRIPEIIEESGDECVTEVLSDEEYLIKLDEKLSEEVAEYNESHSIEELADIYEVVRACAAACGYSINELESIRREKAASCGTFEKKIMLVEVRRKVI